MEHMGYTQSMDRLIQRLARLPGIGRRSAERMAFYLLKASKDEALELAAAISAMKATSLQCSRCANLSESDPCPVCSDPRRDQSLLLVVEEPKDVLSFEVTGMYRGLYHVLMGRLSPLDGVGPGELTVAALLERVAAGGFGEIILGTSPNLEGDGTALYLAQELSKLGVSVTRLARGLPTGWNMEHASKAVLADAIHGRQPLTHNDRPAPTGRAD